MKRARNLIIAFLAVAALALAASWALRPAQIEEPAAETDAETLYSVDSAAITGLSWSWEGGTLKLAKENGVWSCPLRPEVSIDQSAASALAAQAASVARVRALDGADAASFGFDSPRLTLNVTLGEATATLELGLRNDYAGGDYARLNGGEICLTDTALYDAFAVGLKDLVPQDVLPVLTVSDIRTLTIQAGEASRVLCQPEKAPNPFYAWYEQGADGALTPLEPGTVQSLVSQLSALTPEDCVDWQPESLAAYGLETPTVTVTVDYEATDANGATSPATLSLCFGAATAAEVLLGDADTLEQLDEAAEPEVYFRLAGSELVYTAPAATAEALEAALTDYLGPTSVCRVDWDSLRALRLTAADGATVRLGIDVTEETDADGASQTVRRYDVDGRESDYETVYDLYRALRYLSTEVGPADAAPAGDAALWAEFYRDSDTASVVTVTFYPYDGSFYLVQVDGTSRLLVSRRDVEALTARIAELQNP